MFLPLDSDLKTWNYFGGDFISKQQAHLIQLTLNIIPNYLEKQTADNGDRTN